MAVVARGKSIDSRGVIELSKEQEAKLDEVTKLDPAAAVAIRLKARKKLEQCMTEIDIDIIWSSEEVFNRHRIKQ